MLSKRKAKTLMKIELYDVVLLKKGLKAQVVEILGDGECCLVDIDMDHGWDEDDTMSVMSDEIIANFGTWQEADRFRCVVDAMPLDFLPEPHECTLLVFEEGVPACDWQKILVNGTEHKPVFASNLKDSMIVIEGLHEYKGMIVKFI